MIPIPVAPLRSCGTWAKLHSLVVLGFLIHKVGIIIPILTANE